MWKIKCVGNASGIFEYELQHYSAISDSFQYTEYWGSWIGCILYMRRMKLSNQTSNRIMIAGPGETQEVPC